MVKRDDIMWAAGFLEGEGCFQSTRNTALITATQVQESPLLKLNSVFGGKIRFFSRRNPSGCVTNYYRWELYGAAAVGMMMTLFSLMSPKRRSAIETAIHRWRNAPGQRRNATDGRFLPKEVIA